MKEVPLQSYPFTLKLLVSLINNSRMIPDTCGDSHDVRIRVNKEFYCDPPVIMTGLIKCPSLCLRTLNSLYGFRSLVCSHLLNVTLVSFNPGSWIFSLLVILSSSINYI